MVRTKVFFIIYFLCVLRLGFSEDFVLSEKNHNNLVYTYQYDNSLVRKEYDAKKRLILKITWDTSTDEMLTKISYSYLDDSMFPFASETVFFLESKVEKREYTDKGKEKLIQTYEKDELVSEKRYSYDSEGQTVSFIEKQFEILDKESPKTKITENEIKYEYVVFDSKTFVNEYHFENNVKNKEKIYLSSTKYYENAFFEGDIQIYSEYENNLKKLEITYFQGKELRRK